jgi:hypothetical protein
MDRIEYNKRLICIAREYCNWKYLSDVDKHHLHHTMCHIERYMDCQTYDVNEQTNVNDLQTTMFNDIQDSIKRMLSDHDTYSTTTPLGFDIDAGITGQSLGFIMEYQYKDDTKTEMVATKRSWYFCLYIFSSV